MHGGSWVLPGETTNVTSVSVLGRDSAEGKVYPSRLYSGLPKVTGAEVLNGTTGAEGEIVLKPYLPSRRIAGGG